MLKLHKITKTHYVMLRDGQPVAHAKFMFAGENWIVYLQGKPGDVVTYKSFAAVVSCMKALANIEE